MQDSERRNLETNPWLMTLPNLARQELIRAATVRLVPAQHRVQGKDEAADGLYGLLDGEVRVSASTVHGGEIVLTRLMPGEWFGEIAVLDGGLRTHDAYTTVDSALAILPKAPLLEICQRFPEVYRALVLLLCEHCRLSFTALDEFLIFTPEQRLARRILLRMQESGANRIAISQEEMGALVGISRQSTNKILRAWEANGWVRRVYRGLEIIKPGHLRQLLA